MAALLKHVDPRRRHPPSPGSAEAHRAERVRVAFLFLEAPAAPVVTEYLQSDLPGLRTALSHRLKGLLEGDYSKRGARCEECSLVALCAVLDAPVGRVDPHRAIV